MKVRRRGGRAIRESSIELVRIFVTKRLNYRWNHLSWRQDGRYSKKQFRGNSRCRGFVVVGFGFQPPFAAFLSTCCSETNFFAQEPRVTPGRLDIENRDFGSAYQYVVLRIPSEAPLFLVNVTFRQQSRRAQFYPRRSCMTLMRKRLVPQVRGIDAKQSG